MEKTTVKYYGEGFSFPIRLISFNIAVLETSTKVKWNSLQQSWDQFLCFSSTESWHNQFDDTTLNLLVSLLHLKGFEGKGNGDNLFHPVCYSLWYKMKMFMENQETESWFNRSTSVCYDSKQTIEIRRVLKPKLLGREIKASSCFYSKWQYKNLVFVFCNLQQFADYAKAYTILRPKGPERSLQDESGPYRTTVVPHRMSATEYWSIQIESTIFQWPSCLIVKYKYILQLTKKFNLEQTTLLKQYRRPTGSLYLQIKKVDKKITAERDHR